MIRNILANKATFITDQNEDANFGECIALDLYKTLAGKKSRILFSFNTSEVQIIDKAILILKNIESYYDAPSDINLEICPILTDWNEGSGRYQYPELYYNFDKGFCNWNYAKRNIEWTTPGGDYDDINKITINLDKSSEDINVDITSILSSGSLGLLIKFTDELEQDSEEYFIKRFEMPILQVYYEDCFIDKRNNFNFDESNDLYIYNLNPSMNINNVMAYINDIEYESSGSAPENAFHVLTEPILTSSSGYLSGTISEIWTDSLGNVLYSGSIDNYFGSLNNSFGQKDIYINFLECNNKTFENNDIIPIKFKMTEILKEGNVRSQNLIFTNMSYELVSVMNKEIIIPRDATYTKFSFDSEYYYCRIFAEDLQPGWYKLNLFNDGYKLQDFCQFYINPSE